MTIETWDLYVINTGDRDELAAADASDIGMPTHELALLSDAEGNLEVALAEIPSGEMSFEVASISTSSDESERASG